MRCHVAATSVGAAARKLQNRSTVEDDINIFSVRTAAIVPIIFIVPIRALQQQNVCLRLHGGRRAFSLSRVRLYTLLYTLATCYLLLALSEDSENLYEAIDRIAIATQIVILF